MRFINSTQPPHSAVVSFISCTCLYRSIQARGLQQKYATDADFALTTRMLSALAFVLVSDVIAAFNTLCDNGLFPDARNESGTILKIPGLGVRSGATVAEQHDVSSRCLTAISPSTLVCRRRITRWKAGIVASCNHPSIWKFIVALKTEQAKNNVSVEQSVAGQQRAQGLKKYRHTTQRISCIVERYGQVDIG